MLGHGVATATAASAIRVSGRWWVLDSAIVDKVCAVCVCVCVKPDSIGVMLSEGTSITYILKDIGSTLHSSEESGAQHSELLHHHSRPPVIVFLICNISLSKSGLPCHKCTQERRKPVADQSGSSQCTVCLRWFRSHGRLT